MTISDEARADTLDSLRVGCTLDDAAKEGEAVSKFKVAFNCEVGYCFELSQPALARLRSCGCNVKTWAEHFTEDDPAAFETPDRLLLVEELPRHDSRLIAVIEEMREAASESGDNPSAKSKDAIASEGTTTDTSGSRSRIRSNGSTLPRARYATRARHDHLP